MEPRELTLIDAGIASLTSDVVLTPNLTSLNLHCNFVRTIENLHLLRNLQHLDLSSNQVKVIRGLDRLACLRTLNLSCNQIQKVQGLTNLHNLLTINLSYNNITDLSGFSALKGEQYHLQRIDLQGNKVHSQKQVIQNLRNCTNLRTLILRADGAENPVCGSHGYRVGVLAGLVQVHVLDWTDRTGNVTRDHSSDVPGLDDFLSQILPATSSSSSDVINVKTPKIDAVIDTYKQRQQHDVNPIMTSESTDSAQAQKSEQSSDTAEQKQKSQKQELDRLHRIEQQLAELLESRSNKGNRKPKRDTDLTDDSDSSEQPKRPPSRQTSHPSSRHTPRQPPSLKLSKTPPNKRPLKSKQATAKAEEDDLKKQQVELTYQHLIDDLNTERERRYKAEHAAKQLADRLKQLQINTQLMDEKQGVAIETSGKLKDALLESREVCKKLQEENQTLKDDLLDFQNRLEQSKEAHHSTLTAMKSMEESVNKIETEKHRTNAHYTKLINEAETRAAAAHREIDILRVQIKEQKSSIQQLQQLLASREQEHRKELDQRYALNSPEIRELLQKEASHVEAIYQSKISGYQKDLEVSRSQYTDLEDEFRTALHIEANRYSKLHDASTKLSQESDSNRQELLSLRHKDEKATQIVTELTQLVKEQKGRIAELAKSKHDQLQDQKDRIQTLEAHLEEARRRIVQHELLKQDNKRLQAQLDAQESIIEGLRAERKLWGQELAQQGSSLAQDRGRLEAKIEALNHEISYLKKQLEKEVDGAKIKSKLIDDQTETIRHLKEALVERDEQVKTAREEALTIQKKLENELCDEKQAYRESQDMIETLTERKQQLKDRVLELEHDLDTEREQQTKVNNKWKEKAELITHLEKQVVEMTETWERKEATLTDEKEKALRAANLAIDKMRQMDAAFRQQYDVTQRAHQVALARVEEGKREEVERMSQRVKQVEEEMRIMLQEQDESRRQAEDRVKKMAAAFTELQQQLL